MAGRKEQSKSNSRAIGNLFINQFRSGKTIEVINGDILEMPKTLLKSVTQQTDKIMVIGIFGPQSSGKSTLLNYLFGCDFLSSDGRCTSGVYGTYYEISNRNIHNCKGILILDTEGLFANFTNKYCSGRTNFDNKLVLFLLEVCDLVILNTRGDIDKNCQNILELSFDSTLLAQKKPHEFPNFYVVLNQNGGVPNNKQLEELQTMRAKIITSAPPMAKLLTTNESEGIPMAFNFGSQVDDCSMLRKLQGKKRTPTDDFYNTTKRLSFKLIELLE